MKTRPFDASEYLTSPESISAYLDAYREDGTQSEIVGASLRISYRNIVNEGVPDWAAQLLAKMK